MTLNANQHTSSGRIFRVQGVPLDWDATRLALFLRESFDSMPTIGSLALEVHGRAQSATVFFQTEPDTLHMPGSIKSIQLPRSPKEEESRPAYLVVDTTFYNLTTLFRPPEDDHEVDLIALPGLGGHAFGSFRQRSGDYMWLRDSLPYDLTSNITQRPMGRMIIFGYESGVIGSTSFQNLEDLAITLCDSLLPLVTSPIIRPIVFIAHSLGGLIIKQALILLSKSKTKEDQRLFRAICGIAFFGVPHNGMDIRSLIPMVAEGPNRFLIESLQRINSQILSVEQQEFESALGKQGDSEVLSFYETMKSATAMQNTIGNWVMDGPPAILVGRASAIHGRPWENGFENICAVDADHSSMVKFDPHDHEYDKVRERLCGLASRALNKLASGHRNQGSKMKTELLQLEAANSKTQLYDQDHDSAYASASKSTMLVQASESEFEATSKRADTGTLVDSGYNGEEIQSVVSDDDDISSQASDESTVEEMTGKALIRLFLAEDLRFRALCLEALPRLGRARFVQSIRRLLKYFYKNLLGEAQTETEKAVARLLRGRRGRLRISNQLALDMEPEREDLQNPHPIAFEDKTLVESWLRRATGDTVHPKWEGADEVTDDNASTSSSEEDTKTELFPLTSNLRSFLSQSRSFQELLNDLRVALLPVRLKQVLQSIPGRNVYISQERELSFSDKIKTWVERKTQLKWNWWPLHPPKRKLQHDEVRVIWRCSCGAEQWQEISKQQQSLVEECLAYADPEPQSASLCGVKKDSHPLLTQLNSLLQRSRLNTAAANSHGAQKYTPSGKVMSPTLSGPQTSPPVNTSTASSLPPTSQRNSQSSQKTLPAAPMSSTQDEGWILFGVQGASVIMVPSEIQVKSKATDYSVFQDLKRCYRLRRGRLRMWFSIWRLDHCQVVKFDRLGPECMTRNQRNLPTHQEYKYEPRPGRGAINPPIGAHSFNALFYACSQSCAWRSLHGCKSISTGSMFHECIPRRSRSFTNDLESPIWGLEVVFEPSTAYVLAYHCCIIVAPLIFWGWWLRFHPDDLQNASVPITVILTGLSLFWSCAGILTSREQKI